MSFLEIFREGVLDLVELPELPRDTLVCRFPRFENEITNGAKLVVREGQGAIFVNEGRLADIFGPGTFQLETRNLPLLADLRGWPYGFRSPFKAEIYFFSTRPLLNQQWGTQQPILLSLPGYGLAELRAFGQTGYRIGEPATFFQQMVGTTGVLQGVHLRDYLRGLVLSSFSEALTRARLTAEALMGNLAEMDKALLDQLREGLRPLGLEMVQFVTESISLPPSVRDELMKYSRLDKIDLARYTQFEVARAVPEMAGQGTGLAAQAVQVGVGLAASQQILRSVGDSLGLAGTSASGNLSSSGSAVPPPLPGSSPVLFHVALDGKAQGPLGLESLAPLAVSGALRPETLVWQPGMSGWSAAASVPALRHLFPQEPPPLPV